MGSNEERAESDPPAGTGDALEPIGEGLLLAAILVAPWIYGSVEDTARYALCGVLLLAAGLCLWPELRERRLPRGARIALAFPALALAQVGLRQSIAPFLSFEGAAVGFAIALAWAAIDARGGSASTHTNRRLAAALLLVCASESAFAAFQWSTDRTALFGQKSDLQTMPFGSYVNHNNFAGLVSLGVPLAIAMAMGDLRRSGRLEPRGLALMGLACGLTIMVLASGSRGAAVALGLGLSTLAWIAGDLRRRKGPENHPRPWLAPLAAAAGVLLISALAIPAPTRSRLVHLLDLTGSAGYRVDIGLASLRAFAHRPILGSGLGAFADAVASFKTGHGDVRSERAEADLIEFAVEGGLILLAGLILFARFAWKSAHHEMVNSRDRSGRWLRAGALASCLTMLFHSLFDFGFRIPANALAFAVLLGIATAGSTGARPSAPLGCRAFIALLGVLALSCAYRSVGAARERAALARVSPESRLDALQSLVDAHPYLDNARRQRGLAWMALAHNRGQYDATRLQRAREDLEVVVRMRPQWGEARADLAWVKYYQGRTDEAKAVMRQATRFDPTHMGVGIGAAQMLAWSGDIAGAVGELARLRRANPAWPRASALDLAGSWTRDPALLANIP
ncbi:MAG: tetratricopeptide repeat protein [Fimbriimonadaceae bacterium]|nr:tetratricopeptide repeat protein [Fimbriimonadaceae bacterium]